MPESFDDSMEILPNNATNTCPYARDIMSADIGPDVSNKLVPPVGTSYVHLMYIFNLS